MKKRLAAAPALLLVIVALGEIVATGRASRAVPDDDAWTRAARALRAAWRPGDLIVFAPAWIDPVGRMHVGDLIPLEMAARMDAARYGSIWELAIRGAHAPEVAGIAAVSAADFAGVTLRHYTPAPALIVDDVLAHEPTSDGARPTLELAEVGFAPHRCWQIVPPAHGKVTLATSMTLGTKLVGYVGLADVFKRRDIRTPGELEIHAGSASVDVEAGVEDGWVRFELATTPGPAKVTFIARAVSPDRLICFAAEARR